MSKETGGPAFPMFNAEGFPSHNSVIDDNNCSGMTLRDYFAAKAMQAMWPRYNGMCAELAMCADEAYRMADAMLKARENK